MARPGAQGFEVYIQNSAPIAPSPGDFWFDTSGATVLNFRTNFGNWLAVSIPTAALNTLSDAVSVLSQNVSVLSQAVSVVSNAVSIVSQAVSVGDAALSVRIDTQSQSISVLSQQVSVISQALSALSQGVSVISAQLVSAISIHNVLSAAVSVMSTTLSNLGSVATVTLSNAISVISQQVSVISAGLGGLQLRVVSLAQGVSSTAAAGIAVSGLSISVAAGGIYQVDGKIMYRMSAADALGIILNFPAMVFAAGTVKGSNLLTQLTSVVVGTFDEGASNSVIFSAIMSTTSTAIATLDAIFNVSAAGTIQLNARVSATANPVSVLAGSYLRAYRIV